MGEMENVKHETLLDMCMETACKNKQNVDVWRRQKRSLERLPAQLAEFMFRKLLQRHLVTAPMLELFQLSIEQMDLRGQAVVDAEWMAYLGGFRHLRVLSLVDCKSLNNAAIWHLISLNYLEELYLDRCGKITDEGIRHLMAISTLKKLGIAETKVGPQGVCKLSALNSLTYLDLGGLPVTDAELPSLHGMVGLEYLSLWGCKVSNEGVRLLLPFLSLEILNLAWTDVNIVPPLPIQYLNLCNCKIVTILEGWDRPETTLQELHMAGSFIYDTDQAFSSSGLENLSILDISSSNLTACNFLYQMKSLYHLNLASTGISNGDMEILAECGQHLKWLDLSCTKVGHEGIGILSGHVSKLEYLSLAGTTVDDHVFGYLELMHSLQSIDLSHTAIRGVMQSPSGQKMYTVLSLQQLPQLRKLDLRDTNISDKTCKHIASLTQLSHLHLRSDFLSDRSLHAVATLPNLVSLSFQRSVLGDAGLQALNPSRSLQELDLTACWLLSKKAVKQFSEKNPGILVKHKLIPEVIDDIRLEGPHRDPLKGHMFQNMKEKIKLPLKGCALGLKQEKQQKTNPCGIPAEAFQDERLQYSRLELLSFQMSPLGVQLPALAHIPEQLQKDGPCDVQEICTKDGLY